MARSLPRTAEDIVDTTIGNNIDTNINATISNTILTNMVNWTSK